MFQTNSFAAALALCFTGFTATTMAEVTQIEVCKGDFQMAEQIGNKWKSILEEADDEPAYDLQRILVPLDSQDTRIYLVWTGIESNVPEPELITKLHESVKVDTTISLKSLDFSTDAWQEVEPNEVFELRTYIATSGNLTALHARFQNHTTDLFEKHGMKNVAYFGLFKDSKLTVGELLKSLSSIGNDTADADANAIATDDALVYFLAHDSKEAAAASFGAFRTDEDWIAARTASEVEAGGSLTVGNGVKSLFLKPVF
jgi:hypothetical protein